MKKTLSAILALSMILTLCACGASNDTTTDGNTQTGQQSAAATTGGQAATPTKTSYEKLFTNGPLVVQDMDGMWSYVNSSGEYVFDTKFQYARAFQENGLAAVQDAETGLWGYINTSGEYEIAPTFLGAESFGANDWAAVKDATTEGWGFIDESGSYVIEPRWGPLVYDFQDGFAVMGVQGEQYYINESGEYAFPRLSFERAYAFSEGWAVVCYFGDWGFISQDSELRISEGWTDVYGFDNGLAFVETQEGTHRLINTDMKYVSDMEFYSVPYSTSRTKLLGGGKGATQWSEGLTVVTISLGPENDYRTGRVFINTEGEVVLPKDGTYYESAENFNNGYARVSEMETGRSGYIDVDGNWANPPQLISGEYNEKLVLTRYVDSSGNILAECTIENAYYAGVYREVLLVQSLDNGKFAYVDRDNNMITDFIFEQANAFPDDCSYTKVQCEGFWGIIDGNGDWLIPAQFIQIGESALN